jgi:hypothetical protein
MAEKRSAKQKRKTKNNQKQQSERLKQTHRQLEVELSGKNFELIPEKIIPPKKLKT